MATDVLDLTDAFERLTTLARTPGATEELVGVLTGALEAITGVPQTVAVLDGRLSASPGLELDGAGPLPEDRRRGASALLATASSALSARTAWNAGRVDPVSGALNRAALDDRLDEELARSRREERPLTCVMLDIDAFKWLNDTLGHLAGDAVLRTIATRLHDVVRPFDVVARYGGDEFVVLMEGVRREEAPAAAERLLAAVCSGDIEAAGRAISCTLGVAIADASMDRFDLLRDADEALRSARTSGEARWALAPVRVAQDVAPAPEADTAADDLQLVLRGAGDVLFQPVVELRGLDGSPLTVGFEALSRGTGALVRPDLLLEEARRVGQLVALDEELHRRAFGRAEALGMRSPLSLFVNVEPETLARIIGDDRFWRRTAARFASVSEITERALLERPGALLRASSKLRELGWGIALDDVGAEPRALALLPLIAPDVIKLDLSLTQDQVDSSLSEVTLALSAQHVNGGARLLAEGIETPAHRARGHALGADYGQGWLFGRPGPELVVDRSGIAAVPRAFTPPVIRGVTPYQVVASQQPVRDGDLALLDALHQSLEQRARGLGARGALITAIGDADHAPVVRGRLERLAEHIGVVGLLDRDGDVAPTGATPGHLHCARIDPDDPLCAEWTTVVLCAEHTTVLTARRRPSAPDRWSFTLDHDRDRTLSLAQGLFQRLA